MLLFCIVGSCPKKEKLESANINTMWKRWGEMPAFTLTGLLHYKLYICSLDATFLIIIIMCDHHQMSQKRNRYTLISHDIKASEMKWWWGVS